MLYTVSVKELDTSTEVAKWIDRGAYDVRAASFDEAEVKGKQDALTCEAYKGEIAGFVMLYATNIKLKTKSSDILTEGVDMQAPSKTGGTKSSSDQEQYEVIQPGLAGFSS